MNPNDLSRIHPNFAAAHHERWETRDYQRFVDALQRADRCAAESPQSRELSKEGPAAQFFGQVCESQGAASEAVEEVRFYPSHDRTHDGTEVHMLRVGYRTAGQHDAAAGTGALYFLYLQREDLPGLGTDGSFSADSILPYYVTAHFAPSDLPQPPAGGTVRELDFPYRGGPQQSQISTNPDVQWFWNLQLLDFERVLNKEAED